LYGFSLKGHLHGSNGYDGDEADWAFSEPFSEVVFRAAEAMGNARIHPLLTIAVFNAETLAAAPFPAGNRALAQVATQFLLAKAGYGFVPYCALNMHVEQSAEVFYKAFARAYSTDARENMQPALTIFLRTLQKQKERLEQKIERESVSVNRMPDILQQLLELVKAKGRITISEAAMLTRANPAKVRKHLDALVAAHQLQKHGTTKGVWYSMNN
jgi:Fic family protein